MDKIDARLATLSVEALKDIAAGLMDDQRDEADIVLTAVMRALDLRMPSPDFIAFCDSL
ncbi:MULTISPECIES: hypothetical protein [unclassified Bradyrhizobium]|uniref:hypothetical protein n=1 Tax=unclassified Bradyrhizobium TaxID=2631580 RepID=UPI002916BD51|nr:MULTISPECIES: hypothetical protein [unclassified Bradyrhizobium]